MKLKIERKGFKKALITFGLMATVMLSSATAFADGYLSHTRQSAGASVVLNKSSKGGITVYSPEVYLSEDGTKRYVTGFSDVNSTEPVTYVEDGSGKWVSGRLPTKKTTKDVGGAKSTWSAQHNEKYYDVESSGGTSTQTAKQQNAEEDADILTGYYDKLSLGKLNTPANLLQSVILKGASSGGLRSKSLSLGELAKYPKAEAVDTTAKTDGAGKSADPKDVTVNIFEYGNLKQRQSVSKVGSTTANMIGVLTQQGWLQSSQNDEKSVKWYTTLWQSIKNPVSGMISIVVVALGTVADALTDVFKAIIDASRNIIGLIFPDRIFGLATQETTGFFAQSGGTAGKFVTAVQKFIDTLFGTGQIGLFKLAITIMMAVWLLVSILQFLYIWKTSGIRSAMKPLKNLALRFIAYICFITIISGINTIINSTFKDDSTNISREDNITFDSLKYMVATNGDISVLYPDSYTETQAGHVLSNDEIKKIFKLSPQVIKDANRRVEGMLGSELSAAIDSSTNTSNSGRFDKITAGSQTWNVNTYLDLISQGANASGASIEANYLPQGLSWDNNSGTNKNTFAVMPGRVSGKSNFQDIDTKGTFSFSGMPVFFNSLSDTTEDGGEETQVVAVNGRMGVTYDPTLFNPEVVSQQAPYTYLYGATANNSYTTSNPANYTFFKGLNFNKDLTRHVGNQTQVEDGGDVYKTSKSNGTIATDSDLKKDKSEATAQQLQWENAYMIAMYNKYAGTDVSDASDFYQQGVGHYGFATQSAMILMQSTYENGSITYTGYNANFSSADKGKAQTKDNVYMSRFTMPSSTNILANAISRTAFGSISTCIIMFGAMVAIYQYGTVKILKDAWVAIWRFIRYGSYTAMVIYIMAKVVYVLLYGLIEVFMAIVNLLISLATNSIVDSFAIDTSLTAAIGFLMIGIAILFVKPMIRIDGKKLSVVAIIFSAVGILYEGLKEPVEKLDRFAYGTGDSFSSQALDGTPINNKARYVGRRGRRVLETAGNLAVIGDFINGDGGSGRGRHGSGDTSGSGTGTGGTGNSGTSGSGTGTGGTGNGSKEKQSNFKNKLKAVGKGVGRFANKHVPKIMVAATPFIPMAGVVASGYMATKLAHKGYKAFGKMRNGSPDNRQGSPLVKDTNKGTTPTGAYKKPISTELNQPASTSKVKPSSTGNNVQARKDKARINANRKFGGSIKRTSDTKGKSKLNKKASKSANVQAQLAPIKRNTNKGKVKDRRVKITSPSN
ncbi:TPA: hypothetical protein ACGNDF_001491 [Streptococcus agalactiae]